MDYAQQASFLKAYRRHASLVAALVLATGAFALRVSPQAPGFTRGVFFVLVSALAYTLHYDPKYLHLTIDERKKFAWAIRVRWVLAGLVLLVGGAGVRTAREAAVLAASVLWLLLVNLLARSQFRQSRRGMAVLLPLRYAAADLVLVALLFRAGLGLLLVSALLSASAHLVLVLDEGRQRWFAPLYLLAGSAFLALACRARHAPWPSYAYSLVLFLAAGLGTCWLVWLARHHTRRTVEPVVHELMEFTGFSEEKVRELLDASNEILARNWTAAQLDQSDREALARWYSDNSLYYIFALVEFHLRYRHIDFTLDMLQLARGRCLDYGAGTGQLVLALAARGREVTYFDVEGKSREFAEWRAARRSLRLEFLSARPELEAAGRRAAFDTVISLDVLEHIPDIAGELIFLASLLAPGGRLIISAPVGTTESHPMHLDHTLDVRAHLGRLGLRDAKGFRLRWTGSQGLRDKNFFIFEKPGPPAR